jgi:hypothetical protein
MINADKIKAQIFKMSEMEKIFWLFELKKDLGIYTPQRTIAEELEETGFAKLENAKISFFEYIYNPESVPWKIYISALLLEEQVQILKKMQLEVYLKKKR